MLSLQIILILACSAKQALTLSLPRAVHPAPFEYIAKHASSAIEGTIANSKRDVGGVTLCTEANYGGSCWSGTYPIDTCVWLNGFTGKVLSFRPDADTECYLMQEKCNADMPWADLYPTSDEDADLSSLPWIAEAMSYICFNATTTAGTVAGD